jgi:GDPmannose 4,6-dehydratase
MKKALITGVLGQDGSHLADLLLEKGYEVHGLYKRVSTGNNFSNLLPETRNNCNFHLHVGDILDEGCMSDIISEIMPDEMYSLAAMSHVGQSFKEPVQTFRVNAEAIVSQLDILKRESPNTKFYFASTSEQFGGLRCPVSGYNEDSPFHPRSPYAVAKTAAFHSVRNYREAYGMFACSGLLFNHSSVRRGLDFATRKITHGVAAIKTGNAKHILMGDLSACRDEGSAKDYVMAQWLMLQQPEPKDYVVATGTSVSIRQMLEYVCELADLNIKDVYKQDERFMRPSDVPFLKGDASRIKEIGWKPTYDWKSLLKEMYENDLNKSAESL